MAEPILRWAGSKKKLLPVLSSAAPSTFKRYVEPFVGSAVLFLELDPSKAVLSDINADLIETYENIRAHPRAVWNRVSDMPLEESFYYDLRSQDADSLKPLDRAARFVYLNRFCFNGVYRTNRQGHFNVSRGYGHLYVPSWEVFSDFSKRLTAATLKNDDFEKVVAKTKSGDFLYLDPPYALQGQRDRGEYGVGAFREDDEDRLAEALLEASARDVQVLLSYSPSPRLLRRLKGWHVKRLKVARNVAGFAQHRRTADEILVSNYDWRFNK